MSTSEVPERTAVDRQSSGRFDRVVRHSIDGVFISLGRVASIKTVRRAAALGVDVIDHLPYGPEPQQLLDIYRPRGDAPGKGWPVVIYVHGGAFRMLSKQSHSVIGVAFARAGYLAAVIDYRLTAYPAGLIDCIRAYQWVHEEIERFAGDPQSVILAGESAGANLITAMTVAACSRRHESWAEPMADMPLPKAVSPACGLLQVTDVERFWTRRDLPAWLKPYLASIPESYLGDRGATADPSYELADPLLLIERAAEMRRRLPPFFMGVGTRDPVLDDTRRLAKALDQRGVPHEARYYRGGVHAFHAFVPTPITVRFWRDQQTLMFGVAQVTAGEGHNCVLTVDGENNCWGRGPEGQLGQGGSMSSSAPVTVPLSGRATQIATGRAQAA